jgi:translation initiation factor 3 subunit A
MDLAEGRASAARLKADKVALAAASRVSDLDQEETPESIMLSSMTEEGAKDRTDREVVVPWLRFLWESYRSTLELLYKIPKLEKLYHKTCEKAFKFCQEYTRIQEFKKLCEMLRGQLINLQKTPYVNVRQVKPQWEWTPEALEFHLQTRFAQLEVATSLELWNEGFRTVEDIYAIVLNGKKTPKPRLMVNYYEKLTRIFWVSENKLFHAYAWYKYYCLSCESRKDLKQEEKSMLASCVLLAALTIPSTKDANTTTTAKNLNLQEEDETVDEKSQQMALLLDFPTNLSRQSLLLDILNKGILKEVVPELSSIYDTLENTFKPLHLVKSTADVIQTVKNINVLKPYAVPLQKVILMKLVQQLSRVYSVVKLKFVFDLTLEHLVDLDENSIEKLLIEGVVNKQLQLKFDHCNACIKFQAPSATTSTVENLLSKFGETLNKIHTKIASVENVDDEEEAKIEAEKTILSRKEYVENIVAEAALVEFKTFNDRKGLIERRKEGIEKVQQEKEKIQILQIEEDERRRIEIENRRLSFESQQREEERKKKDKEKYDILVIQKRLEDYKISIPFEDIAKLDPIGRKLLIKQAHDAEIEKEEAKKRELQKQARNHDFVERAKHIESVPCAKQMYEEWIEEDKKYYEDRYAAICVVQEREQKIFLAEQKRLSKMEAFASSFTNYLTEKQRVEHDKEVKELKNKMVGERRDKNIARARRLFAEDLERIEREEELLAEKLAKEERDRVEREMSENLRKKRELEEQAEREREKNLERMKKSVAEAEEAKKLLSQQQQVPPPPPPTVVEAKKNVYVPPTRRREEVVEPLEYRNAPPRQQQEQPTDNWRASRPGTSNNNNNNAFNRNTNGGGAPQLNSRAANFGASSPPPVGSGGGGARSDGRSFGFNDASAGPPSQQQQQPFSSSNANGGRQQQPSGDSWRFFKKNMCL